MTPHKDYQLNAYSIINYETAAREDVRFAISTTEVTWGQIKEFMDESGMELPTEKTDSPFLINEFSRFELLQRYCNWLSEKSGIAESEFCYLHELVQDEPDTPTGMCSVGMTVRAQADAFSINPARRVLTSVGQITAPTGTRLVNRFP